MEVLGCMLVLRRVTTSNISASQAQAQMNPCVACLNALFTNMLTGLADFDLIQVGTLILHSFLQTAAALGQVTYVM